ncbi:hypothetical protein FQN55_006299 [Onygenales sp. PD_40]|nr:hypothetical protein FQN55_006299 [Onygenales sp. PD_40]
MDSWPGCVYQPLPPIAEFGHTPPFTRLLLLGSGQGDEPLRGTLVVHALEPSFAPIPPYEAVSYVWGTQPTQTSIHIDGRPVAIRPHLDAALRSLRLPGQARRLWIDALCIDQSNTDERTRQVKYMRLVYKYATRVVVWLGSWTPGVEMAFELAERLAFVRNRFEADKPAMEKMVLETITSAREAFNHLDQLFDRDYFIRNWCIQEVVASSWAIARCEELEMNFFDLLEAAPYVTVGRDQMMAGKPFEFWNMVAVTRKPSSAIRGGVVEGSMGSLTLLLATTRDFKATDPRDKVFSILGISDEGLEPAISFTQTMSSSEHNPALLWYRRAASGIANRINKLGPNLDVLRHKSLQPDYNKDLVDVYRDLTRFLIRKSPRVLTVLSHVQHTDNPAEGNFPSWVPKWYQPRSCSIFDAGCFLAGFCDGHFRYFAEAEDMPLSREPVRPNSLQLRGFPVDKVKLVSDVITYGLSDPLPFQQVWDQVFGFPINQARMPLYHDKSPLIMAVCKTMLALPLGAAMGDIDRLPVSDKDGMKERFIRQGEADAAAYLITNIIGNEEFSVTYGPQELSLFDLLLRTATTDANDAADMERFQRGAKSICFNRRFYVTEGGYLGIGPQMMRPGDEVCVLFGGRVPFILRPITDHYLFIGDTYFNDDDVMWGKLTEGIKQHKRSDIPVTLYEMR